MQPFFIYFSARLLLCIVLAYFAWQQAGVIGLVFSSLIFGIALANPLLELMAHINILLKQSVLSGAYGRHYVFQMTTIDIVQDEHRQLWLSLNDVRLVINGFPRDAVLFRLYPNDCVFDKKLRGSRINALALVNYLQASKNVTALKFMRWIEREVIFPSQQNTQ